MSFLGPDRRQQAPERLVESMDHLADNVGGLTDEVKIERKGRGRLVVAVLVAGFVALVATVTATLAINRLNDVRQIITQNQCRSDLSITESGKLSEYFGTVGDGNKITLRIVRFIATPASQRASLTIPGRVPPTLETQEGLLAEVDANVIAQDTAKAAYSKAVKDRADAAPNC